jgi:F-type H+-transporting ATPase subunit b
MGGILSTLADLFISTIPTVIFVFVLFIIFTRFLFRPLTAVMKKREEETTGAMARARDQAAGAEEKTRQYEAAFQAARQEVYRQREAARRAMLEDRQAAIDRARQQSETLIKETQAGLAVEVAKSQKELLANCQSLGQEIASTVLGAPLGEG